MSHTHGSKHAWHLDSLGSSRSQKERRGIFRFDSHISHSHPSRAMIWGSLFLSWSSRTSNGLNEPFPFPKLIYTNYNMNLKRKMKQRCQNLNIMNLPIGLPVSTLFGWSSSLSSSLGFLAQLASLLPITSGGICWCSLCLESVCRLIFWFSMPSHLVRLEHLELLS